MNFIIEQASSYAGQIDQVIIIIAIIVGFWLLAAELVLFGFVLKYKRKNRPKADYVTGEKHHEKKIIHWAHYAVIACDVVIIYFAIVAWNHVKQSLPQAGDTVRIVGQQWAWKITHPGPDGEFDTDDDITKVDEMNLKVNTVYHYKLRSDDVLHSFSVPVFRLKQDAIPGREITGWFKPTKTGTFDMQCAEMCGIGHGIMGAKVVVQSESDYEAWFNEQTPSSVAATIK